MRENEPRRGQRNNEIQSNVTDNESAKIKSSRGMIQGYNGIALVDARHQIVLSAGAHGRGPEHELLRPTLENLDINLKRRHRHGFDIRRTILLGDTGYFSEDNLAYLARRQIEAVIPDQGYRRRDDRFVTARRYKDRIQGRQRRKPTTPKFTVDDFRFNKQSNTYSCPASKTLRQTTASMWIHDTNFRRYAARASDCSACQLRKRCLGTDTARRRNLHIINNRGEATHATRMKAKIDALRGRQLYSKRMGIVEPVFANITFQKGLNRFTLRGQQKVNAQWLLYCMVHNIEKIANAADLRRL